MTEFGLIARYFSPPVRHTLLAGGDDAALLVVPAAGHVLAVSTDMLAEGTHFLPGTAPEGLGHKALAVNLSDLAAMGARPRWAFLALALPSAEEAWVEAFARGFLGLAERHGVDLAGGDMTRGPLNITVTVVGEVQASAALCRSGGVAGDDLWLSGCTGEAAIGLAALRGEVTLGETDRLQCVARLERPVPRVELGLALAGIAHAAIDISDGLVADVGHLAARSGLRAEIEAQRVPLSSACTQVPAERRLHAVFAGGDDYELVFAAPPERRADIAAAGRRTGVSVTRIGTLRPGVGVTVRGADGAPVSLPAGGYDHFR